MCCFGEPFFPPRISFKTSYLESSYIISARARSSPTIINCNIKHGRKQLLSNSWKTATRCASLSSSSYSKRGDPAYKRLSVPPTHQVADPSHLTNGLGPPGFVPNTHPSSSYRQPIKQHPDHVPVIPYEYLHPWNKNQPSQPQPPGFTSHPGNSATHGSYSTAWNSNGGHERSRDPHALYQQSPYTRRPSTPNDSPVIPPMMPDHLLDQRPGPSRSSHRNNGAAHGWDFNRGSGHSSASHADSHAYLPEHSSRNPYAASHVSHFRPLNSNHGFEYSRHPHAGSLPHDNQGLDQPRYPYPGFPSPYTRQHFTPPSSPVIPDELDDYSPGSSPSPHPPGNGTAHGSHLPHDGGSGHSAQSSHWQAPGSFANFGNPYVPKQHAPSGAPVIPPVVPGEWDGSSSRAFRPGYGTTWDHGYRGS